MNSETLKAAIAEAKRFVKRAEEMPDGNRGWEHPRESGAVKRASMDLTRALADLRRSA